MQAMQKNSSQRLFVISLFENVLRIGPLCLCVQGILSA